MRTLVNVSLVNSEHVPPLLNGPSVAIIIDARLIGLLCFAFPQEPRVAVAIHLYKYSFNQEAEICWAREVRQSPALGKNLHVCKQGQEDVLHRLL
jgi:hypothetical protein